MFKDNISSYHLTNDYVVSHGDSSHFFFNLKTASEQLTISLLNSVYYVDGYNGIQRIHRCLHAICQPGAAFNPDVLNAYNLLVYSSPFILCQVYNADLDLNTCSNVIGHSPYELIASQLNTLLSTYSYQDLSFVLRHQLRFEHNMPDIGALRDTYDYLLHCFNQARRFASNAGYGSAASSIFATAIYYTNQRLALPNTASFIPFPGDQSITNDLDRAIQILVDVILNA
jgi:hypothetical protein